MNASLTCRHLGRRRIDGARVLVTGASSGVGRALALELASRGARVLATARRANRLDLLRSASMAMGATTICCESGDVTHPAFRTRLVEAASESLGGLDILVAAAGSGAVGSFQDASSATLSRIMDIDFFAPAELVRQALPTLRRSPDPALVLVGSILGHHPLPLHAEYCAAKAALRSLAECLRMELAGAGVDVMLATLGPTTTEFWDSLIAGRRAAWSRGRPLSAERTARIMVDALVKRRHEVVPGWTSKGYVLAARLLPGILRRVLASKIASSSRP